MSRSEARTRKELIDPKLKNSGWSEHDWQIEWEYQITDGRIHFDGKVGRRGTPKKADYLLRYAPSKAIAVVEAKKESDSHLEGAAQAKDYARKLGLWFAYSTNGHEIEFFDLKQNKQKSVEARKILNNKTFYGKEKTPLPYVLGLMNMTLHGVDYPRIAKENTLQADIRQIDERDKFDVIIANPPFGGKEQELIQKNFPVESNATELLFLQHIEKSLKTDGRCAVVVPEGVLFQTNAAYQAVKKKLLTECNLHTVVSLPAGVFLPYSAVKTSVIFFDKTKKTKNVWFYEVKLLEDKKLTKKAGITEDHFNELTKLYKKRENTENSWLIPVENVLEAGCNLSAGHYNPKGPEEVELREPEEYAQEIKDLLAQASKAVDELLAELKS